MVALFYLAWVTPYRVAFDAAAYGVAFWFEFAVDIYFILDVFLNFVTGFWQDMDDGTTVLISAPRPIAWQYLTTWFIVDVVACAPVDLVTRGVKGELGCSFNPAGCTSGATTGAVNGGALKMLKMLRIFRLLKLARLFRVSRLVMRYQDKLIYYHSFINIGRINLVGRCRLTLSNPR